MQHYFEEPGLLYDCLRFLSLCHEKAKGVGGDIFPEVREALWQNGMTVPEHLSPLLCRHEKQHSFLISVLFDGWTYSQCGFARIERAMQDIPYMKKRLAEFYCPGLSSDDLRKITQAEYPDAIGLLKKAPDLSELQADLLFILVRFDEAMRETAGIIGAVRGEMEKQHRQFTAQNKEWLKRIGQAPVIEKLRAISGSARDQAPVRYSLSLMSEERISFRPEEPDFFILGSRYEDTLETRHKYREVTPASFIRALGNEAKRLIFEALLDTPEMSAADMETRLHLSRNAVARNIKELRESGVVKVTRVEDLSYYYILNREYIGVVAGQLERLKYQENMAVT